MKRSEFQAKACIAIATPIETAQKIFKLRYISLSSMHAGRKVKLQ